MQEPVSKSDAKELSEEYKQTLKTALSLIFAKIKDSGRKANNEVTIKIGKDDVYRSVIGKKPTLNRLSKDNIEQIEIALTRPQELKGTINISVGDELVYSVKNGKVLTDLININPNRESLESAPAKEKDEYATLFKVQMEMDTLEKDIRQKQGFLNSLSEKHPDLEQELMEIKQTVEEQKETFNRILGELRRIADKIQTPKPDESVQRQTKLKETFGNIFNKLAKVLTPNFTKLQTQLDERLSHLEGMMEEINEKFDNTLQQAKGQDIAAQARQLLRYRGELDEANNSVDFESNKYLFIVKDKILSVSAKDWRGEVLNDKGFTEVATKEDMEALEHVETYIEKLKLQRTPLKVAGLSA